MSQMIIANRLVDGAVVFLGAEQTWVTVIDDAVLIESEHDGAQLLAQAKLDEVNCIVIDPYLIPVTFEDQHARPDNNKESIRAFGPTVRTEVLDRNTE